MNLNPSQLSPIDRRILDRMLALENREGHRVSEISYDGIKRVYRIHLATGETISVNQEVALLFTEQEVRGNMMAAQRLDVATLRAAQRVLGRAKDWQDTATYYIPPTLDSKPQAKPNPPTQSDTILVVGFDQDDSFDLIHLLGLEGALHVTHYKDMLRFRDCPVYITERGPDRKDFGAIEGLFIQGGHRVIDVME